MAANDVPVFVRILGDVRHLSKQLEQSQKDVRGWVGAVESSSLKASVSFGAVGLGLESIAVKALQSSANFEQMSARLLAVAKNAQVADAIFQQAVQAAAVTPFSVNSFVQAAVTLTAFRQNAQQVTPVVADLAAAMGVPLQDAAVIMGKALSGTREGYQSLHERAGIAAEDLKRFGAQLDSNRNLALGTTAEIEAARKALLRYAQTNFGGTAAAMADTLSGKFSNLQDALEVTAAKYADRLAPAAKLVLDVLTQMVSGLGALPPWFQTLSAAVVVGGGAFALLGSAMALSYGKLLAWGAELSAMALRVPQVGAAVTAMSAWLSASLGPALSKVTAGFAAAGPYMAAFAALLAAGELAIYSYKSAIEAWDRSLVNAAKNQTNVGNTVRNVSDVVNKVAGAEVIKLGNDLPKFQKDLERAFSSSSPEKMVTALEKAGYTLDSVRKQTQTVEAQAGLARDRYMALAKAIEDAHDLQTVNLSNTGQDFTDLFGGNKIASIDEAKAKLKELKYEFVRTGEARAALQAVEDQLKRFVEPLSKSIEHARLLDSYLKFAERSRDAKVMTDSVKTLRAELAQMQAVAKEQGLPRDRSAALQQLKTAQGTRKQFLEEYLTKLDQTQSAEKRYNDYLAGAEKERLTQLDRRREREESATGPGTTRSARLQELSQERAYLEQRLQVTKGASQKELALEKALNAARGTSKESQLQDELNSARQMADEEIRTRSRLRTNKRATIEVKAGVAREGLDDLLKTSAESMQRLKDGSQGNAQNVVNAYQGVLTKLDAWKAAHKDLIAGNDELRIAVQDAQQRTRAEIEATKQALKSENFQQVRSATSEALAGEANVRAKIALTNQAILSIEKLIKSETIGRKEGLAEIQALKKSAVDLAKQEAQIESKDKLQGLAEERAALDQEIEILNERKAAGEDVDKQLMAVRRQRLQATLDAINLEAQAEIAAGRNSEAVEASRTRKVEALFRDEYQKELQKYNQSEAAAKEHANKLDSIAANRLGGKRSPLKSFEEAFNGAGSFGFSDFNLDDSASRLARAKPPTPGQVAAQLGLDPKASRRATDTLQPLAPGSTKTEVINVHLNAQMIPPDIDADAKRLGKRLADVGRQNNLRVGSGAPPLTKGQR